MKRIAVVAILPIACLAALALLASANAVGITSTGHTSQGETYYLNTTSVKGYFVFYGGSFYSGPPVDYNASSVQLNAVLTNGVYDFFVQNVLVITANSNGTYTLTLADNIWNLTPPYTVIPSLVKGNGQVVKDPNESNVYLYAYVFPQNITLRPPFNVTLITNASASSGYIELEFTAVLTVGESLHVFRYDKVEILNPSSRAYFTVGSKVPGYPFPADLELVIGGAGDGSTLYVYNWSSRMMLLYLDSGRYYEVPSAVSYSYLTGESAEGIYEYYKDGYVVQTAGRNYYGELWNIYANISIINNSVVKFYLVPALGEWFYEINGKVFPVNSSEIELPYGVYNITVFLKAGQTILYKRIFEDVAVRPYVVVRSEAPEIYVNGEPLVSYSEEGGYYVFYVPFKGPLEIEFPEYYYMNNSRLKLIGISFGNGTTVQGNTVYVRSPGVYTAAYQLQYLVAFPYNLTIVFNGTVYHVRSIYLPAGSSVYIPSQNITFPNGTLIELSGQTVKINGSQISLRKKVYYYVEFIYNTYVNGLPKSGFYPAGYTISIPRELKNSTTIIVINTSDYYINVSSALRVKVNVTVYYRVVLVLGNYSVIEYYKRGSIVNLSTNITVSRDVVFVVKTPLSITVNSPETVNLEEHFAIYYLVWIHYLNYTLTALLPKGQLYNPGNVTVGGYVYVFSPVNITHPGDYFLNYTVYDRVIDVLPTGTLVLFAKNGSYASVPVYVDGAVFNESIYVTTSPYVLYFQGAPSNDLIVENSSSGYAWKLALLLVLVAALMATLVLIRKLG